MCGTAPFPHSPITMAASLPITRIWSDPKCHLSSQATTKPRTAGMPLIEVVHRPTRRHAMTLKPEGATSERARSALLRSRERTKPKPVFPKEANLYAVISSAKRLCHRRVPILPGKVAFYPARGCLKRKEEKSLSCAHNASNKMMFVGRYHLRATRRKKPGLS